MTADLSLDDVLRSLPPEALGLVELVLSAAKECSARIYLVGGPVRDLLLDREILDVDLIVEMAASKGKGSPASRVARSLHAADVKIREHGRFGTVTLETADARLDLASVRRERYGRPGALPIVERGTLEEDLRRRDFSVNALAIELTTADRSRPIEVIDVAGGLGDLADRSLRVLHMRSFHDDPTRALRAARLAQRLGFSLSRSSRSALRDALRDGVFGAVSGDRLRREIQKCFTDASLGLNPATALRLLADWHVLAALEPGLELPREAVAPLRRLGRAIADPPWRGPRARPWLSGLALWLAPSPPALRKRTLERFSVRGDQARRIADFPKTAKRRLDALSKARGRGAVDAVLAGIDEDELNAVHSLASPALRRRILRWAAEDRGRRLPVGGDELVALGLSGASVGRVLSRIRAAYLDGEVANREEAVALAQELARRPGRAGRKRVKKRAVQRRRSAKAAQRGEGEGEA